MILKDDFNGNLHEIKVSNGTLVSFPNSRFTHAYKGGFRVMLGPMAIDPVDEKLTYSGGCGGCGGCGGGGCGGGGCGGGDGGDGGDGGGCGSGGGGAACGTSTDFGGTGEPCPDGDWHKNEDVYWYYMWTDPATGDTERRRKKRNVSQTQCKTCCCTIFFVLVVIFVIIWVVNKSN